MRYLAGFGLALGVLLGAGALPADALTAGVVTKSEDSETTWGTLRYWVKNAAAGTIITFSGSGTTVNLTSKLVFDKNLILAGPASITQTGSGCVFSIPSGKSVVMSMLTISGGKGSYGGGVENYGTLQMTSCTVRNNSAGLAGGVWNEGTLTMKGCMIGNNTCYYGGGGVASARALTMESCTVSDNTSTITTSGGDEGGGGISTWGTATITNCTITGNTADYGGGVHNFGTLSMRSSTVARNTARKLGGGMYGNADLFSVTVVDNTPDQMYGAYTTDSTCTIGSAPNQSATAFSGYSGEKEPEPRSIVGDSDVAAVKSALANPQSALYGVIEQALAADLGKTVEGKSTTLAPLVGMAATLNAANTFEDVAIVSTDLAVEYTASWPENVRYYALFARADNSGYELADRGVQFEIKAGQSLPDGVTPPDFYVPGEGLMTWKNIVADNGSYDLNPGVGAVTIRVCSVRAAEVVGDTGSGGGCDAGAGSGFVPTMLLLFVPALASAFARRRVS